MATWTTPLRLVSSANKREHWAQRHRRIKLHRERAYLMTRSCSLPSALPVVVTITRVAPRALDTDNAAHACKGIRDGIADALGVVDNDPRVSWCYAQRKGAPKEYAVEVSIEPEAEFWDSAPGQEGQA